VHPGFSVANLDASAELHDVGIARLSRETSVAVGLRGAVGKAPQVGDTVALVGYGSTKAGGMAGIQNTGNAAVTDVTTSEFIVGGGTMPRACFGDSGGPAYAGVGQSKLQMGIASRAASSGDYSCSGASVYTRVDVYGAWIEAVLADAAKVGGVAGGCAIGRSKSSYVGWGGSLGTLLFAIVRTLRRMRSRRSNAKRAKGWLRSAHRSDVAGP
jgi:hypothetical protein